MEPRTTLSKRQRDASASDTSDSEASDADSDNSAEEDSSSSSDEEERVKERRHFDSFHHSNATINRDDANENFEIAAALSSLSNSASSRSLSSSLHEEISNCNNNQHPLNSIKKAYYKTAKSKKQKQNPFAMSESLKNQCANSINEVSLDQKQKISQQKVSGGGGGNIKGKASFTQVFQEGKANKEVELAEKRFEWEKTNTEAKFNWEKETNYSLLLQRIIDERRIEKKILRKQQ